MMNKLRVLNVGNFDGRSRFSHIIPQEVVYLVLDVNTDMFKKNKQLVSFIIMSYFNFSIHLANVIF